MHAVCRAAPRTRTMHVQATQKECLSCTLPHFYPVHARCTQGLLGRRHAPGPRPPTRRACPRSPRGSPAGRSRGWASSGPSSAPAPRAGGRSPTCGHAGKALAGSCTASSKATASRMQRQTRHDMGLISVIFRRQARLKGLRQQAAAGRRQHGEQLLEGQERPARREAHAHVGQARHVRHLRGASRVRRGASFAGLPATQGCRPLQGCRLSPPSQGCRLRRAAGLCRAAGCPSLCRAAGARCSRCCSPTHGSAACCASHGGRRAGPREPRLGPSRSARRTGAPGRRAPRRRAPGALRRRRRGGRAPWARSRMGRTRSRRRRRGSSTAAPSAAPARPALR